MRIGTIFLFIVSLSVTAQEQASPQGAVEKYFDYFNSEDREALNSASGKPFVFIMSGKAQTYDRYGDAVDFEGMKESGWAYSRIHDSELVYADEATAMVAINFSRYDRSDTPISTTDVIYLLVNIDEQWLLKAGLVNGNLTLGKD